jgi:lipid II isoglutaminyl synthase (glutamine-hydrolysing)
MARPAAIAASVARRAVRSAGHAVEWVTGRPLASYDGPVAFEAKVAVARTARQVERLRGRVNVAYPGHVLLRADPRALARLAGRLRHGAVAVSASSGKTTTTAMLTSIARHAGLRPVTNPTGANMPPGLAAELLTATRAARGTSGDVGVFEVDERWLPRVADDLGVRVMVLGNVLRDQVERMGDLDDVAAMWRRMVLGGPADLRLAVDVDDPRLAPLADLRPDSVRFGLDAPSVRAVPLLGAVEPPPCAACGAALVYDPAYLAHLGRWCCGRCGRSRPEPDVAAEDVALGGPGAARFTLRLPSGRHPVRLRVGGLHNVYNAVAAAAGAVAMDLSAGAVVAGLEATAPAWGRGEVIRVDGVDVVLLILKDAVGGSLLVHTILEGDGPLDLLLTGDAFLDFPPDLPFLWDIDVDALLGRLRSVVCAGDQAPQFAMWLKYAGADMARVTSEETIRAGWERALAGSAGRLHVVARMSAAHELQEVLAEAGRVGRFRH